LSSYLARHPYIDRVDAYVQAVEDFLADLLYSEGLMSAEQVSSFSSGESPLLDETQRHMLTRYLEDLSRSSFWSSIVSLSREVESTLQELRDRGRMFHVSVGTRKLERVEQLLTRFLRNLASMREDRRARAGDAGGILLFYLAMLKLVKAESIQKLFREFVPMRQENGEAVRDRRTQIRRLIERDTQYHDQFLSIVRTVYPVLTRQLSRLMDHYGLHTLLLRTKEGDAHREAYLKLLTQFIHDTVNSGLGVAVGIRFTPASEALKEGADELLQEVSGRRSSVST
jgi:hypothetical protein